MHVRMLGADQGRGAGVGASAGRGAAKDQVVVLQSSHCSRAAGGPAAAGAPRVRGGDVVLAAVRTARAQAGHRLPNVPDLQGSAQHSQMQIFAAVPGGLRANESLECCVVLYVDRPRSKPVLSQYTKRGWLVHSPRWMR